MLQHHVQDRYRDRLGPDEVYPGLTEKEASLAAMEERRGAYRAPVIRSARILVGEGPGQNLFNCLVLDQSPTGVLVDMGTLIILPAEVKLQFSSGGTYLARRRWGVGTRAGLEFTGVQLMSDETAAQMRNIARILESEGVAAAIGALRGARFFEHAELQRLSETLETAYSRMAAVLSGRQAI